MVIAQTQPLHWVLFISLTSVVSRSDLPNITPQHCSFSFTLFFLLSLSHPPSSPHNPVTQHSLHCLPFISFHLAPAYWTSLPASGSLMLWWRGPLLDINPYLPPFPVYFRANKLSLNVSRSSGIIRRRDQGDVCLFCTWQVRSYNFCFLLCTHPGE